MSMRTCEEAEAVPPAFDAGRLGRLTRLGLVVAAIGWVLLIGATLPTEKVMPILGVGSERNLHADLLEIARCLIGSGFGLALIGALQTGFGALNRFFAAVLSRSAPRPNVAPASSAPADRAVEPRRERRPYQINADGSVEVETIVGTRRFDTMDEARDFI